MTTQGDPTTGPDRSAEPPRPGQRRWLVLGGGVVVAGLLVVGTIAAVSPQAAPDPGAGSPVIAAAGDIACDPNNRSFRDGAGTAGSCRQQATSDLLVDAGLTAVFALGDLQYYCGSTAAFAESYDPSWGRVKHITRPVVGNHEYLAKGADDDPTSAANTATGCDASNAGAAGYFDYFGAAAGDRTQGWYSFDIGAWHVVVLNSNCRPAGGCGDGSPQLDWLAEDLAAHPAACTMALWHAPRFSSGDHGDDEDSAPFWRALYAAGADVVLNGHEHIYERFAPMDAAGAREDAHGIRQFTVGTGGANHTDVVAPRPNSEVVDDTTFGVLRMTLHPDGYDWQFVPERGRNFEDRGAARCHGPRP